MAELKFNKVPGIDYWLSDEISNEHGNYKYRIHSNDCLIFHLDLINGFQVVNHGEFETFDAAAIKAATLEAIDDPDNRQWPDYGFILQCFGMVALLVLGIICIYKFGN